MATDTRFLEQRTTHTKARDEKKAPKAEPPAQPPVIQQLPIDKVIPTPDNPRTIDPYSPAMKELTKNIEEVGILSPVLVRPHPEKPGCYDLRAGERRWRAAKLLGMKTINAIVREMSDQDAKKITVIENLHREDLSPLEEGRGIQTLLDAGWETKAIAAELGKAPSWVVRRAQLTKLSPAWLKAIANAKDNSALNHWGAAHLELIARLPADTQDLVLANHGSRRMLTIRELGQLVGEFTMELSKASWKLDDATLEPKAGACIACSKRSSCQPGLFEEVDVPPEKVRRKERCLDKACWDRKVDAALIVQRAELAAKHGKVQLVAGGYYGLLEKKLPGAVPSYQLEECKKSDKGAVCCLRVDGRNKGQVYWARPDREISGGGSRGRPLDKDGNPKPRPLAVRCKELNCRREALVNAKLKDMLEAIDFVKSGLDAGKLMKLVGVFGTDDSGAQGWCTFHKISPAAAMASAWEGVKHVLLERLQFFGPQTNVPIEEHDEICALLGLDLKKLRADAAAEIPEPKRGSSPAREGDGSAWPSQRDRRLRQGPNPGQGLPGSAGRRLMGVGRKTIRRPPPTHEPRVCADCGDELPADDCRPERYEGISLRCQGCGLALCPRCIRMDDAGRTWCEGCAEEADVDVSPVCSKCGCTEYMACSGGCSWAYDPTAGEVPVCSACVE